MRLAPGLLLGGGLGGFVDIIVLHQLLQLHHLVSATPAHPVTTVAGLEVNTRADGMFSVVTLLFVVVGTGLLVEDWRRHRAAPPRWQPFVGLLLTGWGVFNLFEGTINHHLLGLHHVRDDLGGPRTWDFGFIGLALGMTLAGLALYRSSHA